MPEIPRSFTATCIRYLSDLSHFGEGAALINLKQDIIIIITDPRHIHGGAVGVIILIMFDKMLMDCGFSSILVFVCYIHSARGCFVRTIIPNVQTSKGQAAPSFTLAETAAKLEVSLETSNPLLPADLRLSFSLR